MIERENIDNIPATTDIPMLRDKTLYKVFVIIDKTQCDIMEIRAVSEVCNINFIEAKRKLKEKKNNIFQGNAYKVKDVLRILEKYNVCYETEPCYPYTIMKK